MVFGIGWEFPNSEAMRWEFPIRAYRTKVPDDKGMATALESLSEWEQSCVNMVYTWAAGHKDAHWTEALLTPANIYQFLVMPDYLKVKGRLFLTKAMMPSPH